MIPECFKDFVGLDDRQNACIPDSISNKATSGLYVTQDPFFVSARFKAGESACDLTMLLNRMREEAYRQVAMDVNAVVGTKLKLRDGYSYFIGQPEVGPYLPGNAVPAQPYIQIRTNYRPGAYVEVRRIALMLAKQAGTFTTQLRVYNETTGTLINAWDIVNTNGLVTTARDVEPFKMPCTGDTYRVEYTYDPAVMRVPDSEYHCSCGDKIKQAGSFIIQNVSKSYGICLDTVMGCYESGITCSLLRTQRYRTVIAFMIRQKIMELALVNIFARQDVNRYTLLSSEDAATQIAALSDAYSSRLKWLQYERDFDTDGFCVTCAGSGMQRISLLTGLST